MYAIPGEERVERFRNLTLLSFPGLWPAWPFLPLVSGGGAAEECGLLCDVMGLAGLPGHSATVFLANLFLLPGRLDELLLLPGETFDTPEEVFASGWRID